MNSNKIKKLVYLSYKKNKLDTNRVNKIVTQLSKSELKAYIKYLKQIEKQKTVTVTLSSETDKKHEEMFNKLFSGKNIKFNYDPSLIAGFKILDNDLVYEYNLKDTIDKITKHITN